MRHGCLPSPSVTTSRRSPILNAITTTPLKRGDFAEAAALKREPNLLVLKVSLQLPWETAKTVMGVAKVIKFFISLAG